jgi:hypothetical protein
LEWRYDRLGEILAYANPHGPRFLGTRQNLGMAFGSADMVGH